MESSAHMRREIAPVSSSSEPLASDTSHDRHKHSKTNATILTTSENDDSPTISEEIIKQPLPSKKQRWTTFRTRLIWTLAMIFGYFFVVAAGHFYCAMLVLLTMALSYKEIIDLKRKAHIEKKLPLFYLQRWYWFCLTLFGTLYAYILPLCDVLIKRRPACVIWIVKNHNLVTYLMIVCGFIVFILSLRRYSIRYQFSQLSLLILTCLVVVGQGTAQIKTISSGLIWFFISTTCVIANDISAYLFGSAYGRIKLIPRISPKKTLEGFLGASVITFLWGLLVTEFLSWFSVMTCPNETLTIKPFHMWFQPACVNPPEFRWVYVPTPLVWKWLMPFAPQYLAYRPVWIHTCFLAAFASFVAPFGGFLASAFKRALRVKDFGASIPGHGGVTDRFDCHLLMGMFTCIWLRTFVAGRKRGSWKTRIAAMDRNEKWELLSEIIADLGNSYPNGVIDVMSTLSTGAGSATSSAPPYGGGGRR